uniref:GDSL esterase/lipase At5g03980 isoform X3 n=1 Tax=Nicotiana tabacum TaxID=4097 RepID=A0A1S4B8L2_TOBAC|nr:PREDICTED: GDSL esterase/lipase At5g03980-like isoform X3 [Nicotiana tabacum]
MGCNFSRTPRECGMIHVLSLVGATALSTEIMAEKKIVIGLTNSSLNVQLDWMSSHFKTTCSTDCQAKLKKSLFLAGEVGGNEFNYGLLQGKTMNELRNMVPEVVQTIIQGVKDLIKTLYRKLVVE